jgi:hypothetical protein
MQPKVPDAALIDEASEFLSCYGEQVMWYQHVAAKAILNISKSGS